MRADLQIFNGGDRGTRNSRASRDILIPGTRPLVSECRVDTIRGGDSPRLQQALIAVDSPRKIGFTTRVFVETVFAGHLVVAAFYWWLSPKGFPVDHGRFWLNTTLPLAVMLVFLLGLAGMLRERHRVPAMVATGATAAWIALGVSARFLFPITLGKLWFACAFPALVGLLCALALAWRSSLPIGAYLAAIVAGVASGFFSMWAQVPETPSTSPSLNTVAVDQIDEGVEGQIGRFEIGDGCFFEATSAELLYVRGVGRFRCSPILEFDRVSPDGFWSLLAPSEGFRRRLRSQEQGPGRYSFNYNDGSTVTVHEADEAGTIELTASSVLTKDTYSHLNSFCVIEVFGMQDPSLSFSPCGQKAIEIMPADYPTGRPARFGFLGSDERFVVVEAASGEKGPFRELASGPLKRGDVLTMTFLDSGKPFASIALMDWTSQLSTALSPTAGWRIPVNSIEFQRLGSTKGSPVNVWISLAATSVGRGWECVGHRAGTYRNRVIFAGAGKAVTTK